jgi:hypothetical protein
MGRVRLASTRSIGAWVGVALALELTTAGCLYTRRTLVPDPAGGYQNYPESVEAEEARRRARRRAALIGGPIEIVGGAAIAALMLYAPAGPPPDDGDDSVTDNLGDGVMDLLARAALATAGVTIATSGVGDVALGLSDPAFASPLVRAGRLVPADEIDRLPPARGPRLTFHATNHLSLRAAGAEVGVGLGHWVGRAVRLRETLGGSWDVDFGDDRATLRHALGGDVTVERAFGRRHAGLYPTGGASWTRVDEGDHAVLRGGLMLTVGAVRVRLGAVMVAGRDRTPTVELGVRRELETD